MCSMTYIKFRCVFTKECSKTHPQFNIAKLILWNCLYCTVSVFHKQKVCCEMFYCHFYTIYSALGMPTCATESQLCVALCWAAIAVFVIFARCSVAVAIIAIIAIIAHDTTTGSNVGRVVTVTVRDGETMELVELEVLPAGGHGVELERPLGCIIYINTSN